jgi:nucleoside-diphosphate-sugar epimerase
VISGEKVLVTGAAGGVAFPLAQALAGQNEVWGAGRFTDPADPARLWEAGITPCQVDVAGGDLSALPSDFTYVLHFAFMRGQAHQFDEAMRTNGEGTGLVLEHCRSAKAALVVSSAAIYEPNPDPWHVYREDGPLGRAFAPWGPTSPVTKVAMEAVARFCARSLALPTVITRLNTVYGHHGGLPSMHLRQVAAGDPVHLVADPNTHSPIHVSDMAAQLGALLDAASTPALVVNWAGDEAVTAQEWCQQAAGLTGRTADVRVTPLPGASPGNIADVSRRQAITGPCSVTFAEGFAQAAPAHLL